MSQGNFPKRTQPRCVTSGKSRFQPWPLGHDFLNSTLLIAEAGSFFVVVVEKGCPVHHKTFSSTSEFYPLDARSTSSPDVTTINVSRYFYMSPEMQNCPIENHWSREKMIA